MTINEAKKILEKLELNIKIDNEQENLDKSKEIITEQIPKEGIMLKKGDYIVCKAGKIN